MWTGTFKDGAALSGNAWKTGFVLWERPVTEGSRERAGLRAGRKPRFKVSVGAGNPRCVVHRKKGHGLPRARRETEERAQKKRERSVLAFATDSGMSFLSLLRGDVYLVVVGSCCWAVFPTFGEVTHEEEASSRQLVGKCGELVPGWFSH